jgi:hypothetical protein
LKRLLDRERRQLFLKDRRIVSYLNQIKPDELPLLKVGDYPAIEALAWAVTELREYGVRPPPPAGRPPFNVIFFTRTMSVAGTGLCGLGLSGLALRVPIASSRKATEAAVTAKKNGFALLMMLLLPGPRG